MTAHDEPHIAAVQAATAMFDQARKAVEEAIFAAYRAEGVSRTAIADASPWTAAHVRKLVRDAGIGPDPAYARRTQTARRRAAETTTVVGRAEHEAERQATPPRSDPWYVAHLTPTQAADLATAARSNPDWIDRLQAVAEAHPEDADRAVVAHATEQRILAAADYQRVGAEPPTE
ncbi:hypothetical protein ABIA32_005841 [Streptacidiphilus sp. MAP12-20]|uniref:hypothetical protein n=1 Tax=Streptacidiphilus sp. MAP12-20 TaxID=3156299 RepID=UPI0035193D28